MKWDDKFDFITQSCSSLYRLQDVKIGPLSGFIMIFYYQKLKKHLKLKLWYMYFLTHFQYLLITITPIL